MIKQKDKMVINLEIVNIVGSGELHREIDLDALSSDIGVFDAEIHEQMQGLLLRIPGSEGLIIVYRSGKYLLRGFKEHAQLYRFNRKFLDELSTLGILTADYDSDPSIKNIVFLRDVGQPIDLEQLVIQIGLENAEFEPEQFPGLVYRPTDLEGVILVFSTGKTLITGTTDEKDAIDCSKSLDRQLSKIK